MRCWVFEDGPHSLRSAESGEPTSALRRGYSTRALSLQ